MSWVLQHSRSEGRARLVALSIANHASRLGLNSWPAQETIASEANMSLRRVRDGIRALVRIGELQAIPPPKFGRGHHYTYILPLVSSQRELPLSAPLEPTKGDARSPFEDARKGDISAQKGGHSDKKGGHFGSERGTPRPTNRPEPSLYEPSSTKPTPTAVDFAVALPGCLEPWKAYVNMRRRKRNPVDEAAVPLLIRQLLAFRASGQDPGAILEQSVMRGWTGLFPIPDERRTNGNGRSRAEERNTRVDVAIRRSLGVDSRLGKALRGELRQGADRRDNPGLSSRLIEAKAKNPP